MKMLRTRDYGAEILSWGNEDPNCFYKSVCGGYVEVQGTRIVVVITKLYQNGNDHLNFVETSNRIQVTKDHEQMEADVVIQDHGSVVILDFRTLPAREFQKQHIPVEGWQRWGNHGIAVEPHYVDAIVQGLQDDGLVVV